MNQRVETSNAIRTGVLATAVELFGALPGITSINRLAS